MKLSIEKVGTIGLFITMMASPCCFPLVGVGLAALGIGSFELFGGWSMHIFLALSLISVAGLIPSYRMHQCLYALIIATISVSIIFYSYFFIDADYWINFMYLGMAGIMTASIVDYYKIRQHKAGNAVVLESVITCPDCGHSKQELMPTNACQFFYKCESCNTMLRPKPGDCCVFCSYGTVKCPPIQLNQNCCA